MSEAVTSSTEQKPSEVPVDNKEDTMEAFNLLAQGKRNMLCGEMPQAINQLQEACRMLAKTYGETADQCGEAYFSYGKALLDMARMETGVLGNALQGMSEDESEESEKSSDKSSEKSSEESEKMSEKEKEEMSDKIIEAMEETDEELKARQEKAKKEAEAKGEKVEEKEEEKMETEEEKKEGSEAVESEDIADEEGEGESQEEGDTSQEEGEKSQEEGEKSQEGETSQDEGEKKEGEKKEEEDDVSNLQLAWEMLELSKNIFKRQCENKEAKIKLAETHLRLGEVGLETEQYETAIGDFQECLKLQKAVLEPENRAMAETCYQLGLAYTYRTEYESAVKHYKEAASIIEAKIAKLTKIVEEGDKSKGKEQASSDDPIVMAQKEISELKEILPDIMGKIEDVQDEQKSADTVKKMVKENLAAQIGGQAKPSSTTGFGDSKSDDKPASDITHLVRKKRKTDEDPSDDGKKPKTDGSGDAQTNGHSNGTQIKTKTVEDVKMAAESTS